MKVYLSADLEGIAGVSHWDDATPGRPGYEEARVRMTRHVAAACEGAAAAGATDVLVKDAHAWGRNLLAERLPTCARLVRGWSGHPLMMVEELDPTFRAVLMVGYHAPAGSAGHPLAHTLSSSKVAQMTVNGVRVSEFHLHAWAAALHDVPVAFVSGDEALCREVEAFNRHVHTLPVTAGRGAATIAMHPSVAEETIRTAVRDALDRDLGACRVPLPDRFRLEIRYRDAGLAHARGFYPGAHRGDDLTVAYEADSWFEVLRALLFLV